MALNIPKPIIGFTAGDINSIGIELIIKTLSDNRILEYCVPVVFANNKSINFYRKALPDYPFNFTIVRDITKLGQKQVNLINCWEEETLITPGIINETGGKYALTSLQTATKALVENKIDALVTAPIHKKNILSAAFQYTGHTPYFQDIAKAEEVLMLMIKDALRVGLVTEHLPIGEVQKHITKEKIIKKLELLQQSLQQDFGCYQPKIAVLGLNPHSGDEGVIGKEEQEIIIPALRAIEDKILVFGPYSADAFFAKSHYLQFDAVLAMYHDQGLIPFKLLAAGEGVNYTAGLPFIRTSPDHGTAFDIAGKGIADSASFTSALFAAIDIFKSRLNFAEDRKNPLQKRSKQVIGNIIDEKLVEE